MTLPKKTHIIKFASFAGLMVLVFATALTVSRTPTQPTSVSALTTDNIKFYESATGPLLWHITPAASTNYRVINDSVGLGVEIDCTKSVSVDLSLTLDTPVAGKFTFQIHEPERVNANTTLFYRVAAEDETRAKGISLGVRDNDPSNDPRNDSSLTQTMIDKMNAAYPSASPPFSLRINPVYFFYRTEGPGQGDYYNSYFKRDYKGNRHNFLSLVTTPAGAYGKLKNELQNKEINLAYLQTNRKQVDPIPADIILPVNYTFEKVKTLYVGCPWPASNTPGKGGKFIVYNPVYTPNDSIPTPAYEVYKQLANKLLKTLPTFSNSAPPVSTGFDPYDTRSYQILALAHAYLSDQPTAEAALVKALEKTPTTDPQKGYGLSDLSLAYWVAATRFPGIRQKPAIINGVTSSWDKAVYDKLALNMTSLMSRSSPHNYPHTGYIARSGGTLNAPVGAALVTAGSIFTPLSLPVAARADYANWSKYGKCFMYHSSSMGVTNETTPSCDGISFTAPKVVYNTNDATLSLVRNTAEAFFKDIPNLDIGPIYRGRLDHHNYGPNPMYIYGGTLGELAKAAIAFRINQFTSGQYVGLSVRKGLDDLWAANFQLQNSDYNLFNGDKITKLIPKTPLTMSLENAANNRIWDNRYNNTEFNWDVNMYQLFGKSESWLDPLTGIAGVVLGARHYNNWTAANQLKEFAWYIANDYGAIPLTTPRLVDVGTTNWCDGKTGRYRLKWDENISPFIAYSTMRNQGTCPLLSLEYGYLIQYLTYIERYVLSALMLDSTINLVPLTYSATTPVVPTVTPRPTTPPISTPIPTAIPPTAPTVTQVVDNVSSNRISARAPFNISITSTDPQGGSSISQQYIMVNHISHTPNGNISRGYYAWSASNSFPSYDPDTISIKACGADGFYARSKSYIGWEASNVSGCSTSVSGNTRTTTFTVQLTAEYTAPEESTNTYWGWNRDSSGLQSSNWVQSSDTFTFFLEPQSPYRSFMQLLYPDGRLKQIYLTESNYLFSKMWTYSSGTGTFTPDGHILTKADGLVPACLLVDNCWLVSFNEFTTRSNPPQLQQDVVTNGGVGYNRLLTWNEGSKSFELPSNWSQQYTFNFLRDNSSRIVHQHFVRYHDNTLYQHWLNANSLFQARKGTPTLPNYTWAWLDNSTMPLIGTAYPPLRSLTTTQYPDGGYRQDALNTNGTTLYYRRSDSYDTANRRPTWSLTWSTYDLVTPFP